MGRARSSSLPMKDGGRQHTAVQVLASDIRGGDGGGMPSCTGRSRAAMTTMSAAVQRIGSAPAVDRRVSARTGGGIR